MHELSSTSMLGPTNAAWAKLHEVLSQLAHASGGDFAFVVDEGNGLWCVAPSSTDADRKADRFYANEIHPRMHDLRHGVPLDIAKTEGDDRYVAISFASIYVVVVWFDRDFVPPLVRARVRRALPEIEALTLALPPPTGPEAGSAAGKLRA